MRKRFTSWAKFRAYVSGHNTGDLITRKNIIEELDGVPHSTIDMFRRVCEKNNILVKMEQPGVYMLTHILPDKMTLNELMLRAYGKKPKEVPKLVWGEYKVQDVIYVHQDGIEPNPLYQSPHNSICDLI